MKQILDITVLIVSFKSHRIIERCLNCLKKFKRVTIIDNSNDKILKKKLEKKYKNLTVYLSSYNLGYAEGNNFLLKKVKTPYALVLSPDTFINKKNLEQLILLKKNIYKDFGILGTIPGAKIIKKTKFSNLDFYKCHFVKGFAMLMNMKAIKKVNFFDGNFFLYLEEVDLCKRLIEAKYNIYASKKFRVTHLGASSSSIGIEYEKNRNWHWMWSQYYFDKKYKGNFYCFKKYFFIFFRLILRIITIPIYKKNIIYIYRFIGLISAVFNIKSYYRPKVNYGFGRDGRAV